MKSMKWRFQHKVPQAEYHRILVRFTKSKTFCTTCGQQVKRVPVDDGPEGLKALLTLRDPIRF